MTYFQNKHKTHTHKYHVDLNTNDLICLCGKVQGDKAPSKYKNKSTIYNGISYHSAFEASYAAELDIRMRAKDIVKWERQMKLDLKVNGMHITNYYIDFIVHFKDGSREFVEAKGMETMEWRMKWKLLEATFDEFKKHPDDRLLVVKQQGNYFRKMV